MMNSKSAFESVKAALVAGVAAAACGLCAVPAAAQPAGQPAGLPSYAHGEESIRGRIAGFDGKYRLQLRDDRGFVDNVRLHDGTIINPTGLRLTPGQSVTVLGHNSGDTFEANEIDTPYARSYAVYGYAPYGYYPYPYGYGFYPAFGLGFRDRGFRFGGWF